MKHNRLTALLLSLCLPGILLLSGCHVNVSLNADSNTETTSPLQALQDIESQLSDLIDDTESDVPDTQAADSQAASSDKQETTAAKDKTSKTAATAAAEQTAYTMEDVKKLKNTQNFSKNALEHIFDGTINSKGNATGYHYDRITASKGQIIKGTESKKDKHGVFTAKVKVLDVKKNGFSSFYPENWSPQQVVDAINEAYRDALDDPSNPHNSLWIGYSGDLEIDMYLDNNKKITTAYPIYEGGN